MFNGSKIIASLALASTMLFVSSQAGARGNNDYHVTITNLTSGQILGPAVVVSHSRDISLFELGAPASDELAALGYPVFLSVSNKGFLRWLTGRRQDLRHLLGGKGAGRTADK